MRVLGAGTGVGGTVYLLKFGRGQELESDWLGVRYMSRLGYNPVGQLQVLEILKKEAGSGRAMPEILSTHPLAKTRISELNEHIRQKYPDYDEPGRYRFGQDTFKTNILDELQRLPPPQHGGENPPKSNKSSDLNAERGDLAACCEAINTGS